MSRIIRGRQQHIRDTLEKLLRQVQEAKGEANRVFPDMPSDLKDVYAQMIAEIGEAGSRAASIGKGMESISVGSMVYGGAPTLEEIRQHITTHSNPSLEGSLHAGVKSLAAFRTTMKRVQKQAQQKARAPTRSIQSRHWRGP